MTQITRPNWQRILNDQIEATKSLVLDHPQTALRWYLAALFLAALAFLVSTPVSSGDTDLWYHMNGGRLLWEFRDLPDTAFFSFMEPQDAWINYFWGFQALTYQIHEIAGYPGLIALRTLLIGVAVGAMTILLYRTGDSPRQRAWMLAILVLAVILLLGRIALIRPHLVSFMMIAVFLLILERRPRWLPVLPVLTLLWINLHGVEWVVGATICGAYFVDHLWRWRLAGGTMEPGTRRVLIWTLACAPALLINPYGVGVVLAPFSTPPDVYSYIAELRPLTLRELSALSLSGLDLTASSAIGLLFYGNLLAFAAVLLRGPVRLAPLLLGIVGLVLLARGQRFIWEWMLLSLPLWRNAVDTIASQGHDAKRLPLRPGNVMLVLLLASPFVSWTLAASSYYSWPLNKQKLPVGSTTFILEQGIQGHLMAPPNAGGYLAWRLYPKVLIATDMSTPPSTPWTHFRVGSAMREAHAMRRLLEEFQPELIAVLFDQKGVDTIMQAQPLYRPVIFDDRYALYANNDKLPDIVKRFELRHVNPHNLLDDDRGSLEQRIEETQRVLQFDPDGDRVLHSLVRLQLENEDHAQALVTAQHFLKAHPENPNSHFLVGNALEKLDRCDEASAHYLAALDVARDDFKKVLYRHLGTCAYLTKDFSAAFDYFDQGLQTYAEDIAPEHRFQFALSAVASGRDERARTLLRHLLYTVDPTDLKSIDKAKALLSDL